MNMNDETPSETPSEATFFRSWPNFDYYMNEPWPIGKTSLIEIKYNPCSLPFLSAFGIWHFQVVEKARHGGSLLDFGFMVTDDYGNLVAVRAQGKEQETSLYH